MRLTPRGQGFPGWVRLRRRSEFQHAYQGGRKCVRRFLVVYAVPAQAEDAPAPVPTRLGITASRRMGKAVARNRFRRRIRDIFRRLHADLAPGWNIVVNARVAAKDAPADRLEKDFRACLQELTLFAPGAPTPPSSPPAASPGADASS
jgi:ribonuclease P protein component